MFLTSQNTKMRRASFLTHNFGIPAFRSSTGLVTCPNAKDCAKGCYAQNGTFRFSNVKNAYERRLLATQSPDFAELLSHEILALRPVAYRWNDSGDFYSKDYLLKAYQVAKLTPRVNHYAYTKQVELVKANRPPPNFLMIFSYGGKQDHLIDPSRDRHAHIFESLEALNAANYEDCSWDDSQAWRTTSNKIGLVFHGPNKNKFLTRNTTTPLERGNQWD